MISSRYNHACVVILLEKDISLRCSIKDVLEDQHMLLISVSALPMRLSGSYPCQRSYVSSLPNQAVCINGRRRFVFTYLPVSFLSLKPIPSVVSASLLLVPDIGEINGYHVAQHTIKMNGTLSTMIRHKLKRQGSRLLFVMGGVRVRAQAPMRTKSSVCTHT